MIALAMVRHRWRSVLGGFVALALGIALLSASAIVIASSAPAVPPRYERADVLAVPEESGNDHEGSPTRSVWTLAEADTVTAEIAGAAGVTAAVAERRFEVRVMDGDRPLGDPVDGDPNGTGWASFALATTELLEGGAPTGRDEVVLPASYQRSPGETVTVLTAGSEWRMTVSGTTDGDDVLVPDALAEETSTAVSLIGVVAEAGADTETLGDLVRESAGPTAEVFTDADRGAAQAEFDSSNNWVGLQLLVLVGLVSVFVSVFVVGMTFTFQVATRRRELALLRAVGATPRQVRGMLLREAVVVGAAASLAGAVLGIGGASLMGNWMVDNALLSRYWEVRSVALPVVVAVVVGVATAVTGVLSAARRGAAITPLAALRPAGDQGENRAESMPRWRWWVAGAAALFGSGSAAAAVLTDEDTTIGWVLGTTMGLVVALALTAPAYLPRLLGLLPLGGSPTAELLRAEAHTGARRLASVMMPALLTSAFTVTMFGITGTLTGALAEHAVNDLPGEATVVGADGVSGITDTALERTVEYAEGPVTSTLGTGVYVDGRWVDAVGLHRDAPPEGTVRASPEAAAEHGWKDGDTVDLTWRDGTTGRVPVEVGPFPYYTELWAGLALPHDLARGHDPGTFTTTAYLDGADTGSLSAALADQGARVESSTVLLDDGLARETRLVELFAGIIVVLAVGYSAISMANTLSLSTSARRPDLALLRVTGAHRRQVLGLLTTESGLVIGVGLLLGGLVSSPALFALAAGLRDDFEPGTVADVSVYLPWPVVGAVFAACLVLGLSAALAPAARALRQPPVAMAAERE